MPILLLFFALLFPAAADARDWYSAGSADVLVRAFVIELDEGEARSLLPSPLTLAPDFNGKIPGKHPVVVLLSHVTPKKAHWMPFLVDMSYNEYAVFMPHVRHPQWNGDFLHSIVLYLDSRPPVWVGRWPYRFPKWFAKIREGEGTQFGDFAAFDHDHMPAAVSVSYRVSRDVDRDALRTRARQLADWMALPLLNGTQHFTCSRMEWELTNDSELASLQGNLTWRDDWLGDARRLAPRNSDIDGIRLRTLWYLSMPSGCGKYKNKTR